MNQNPRDSVWVDIPRHMALVPYRRSKLRMDFKSLILIGMLAIPIVVLFVILGGPGPFLRIP